MQRVWRIRPHDPQRVEAYARTAGVPPIVAQLLLARGFRDAERAQDFLAAKLTGLRDPDELPGVPEAAERVFAAIREKRKIVLYGDYDVDGITGTSLLWMCLRMLGAEVSYFLPNRLEEGYGLNCDALRKLAAEGASLVISIDCGITALEPARVAREVGLELIITDHHTPLDELPDAAAIVHPGLPQRPYGFSGLCGSAVALKLAWALCRHASGTKKVGDRMRDYLLQAVAMAALGTVADVVPLIDENRILVRHGLVSLMERPTIGLQQLLKVCDLHTKEELQTEDFGFMLAPRINAAGRFGQGLLAVELLTTDNPTRAEDLAKYINELNESRQKLERKIAKEAKDQAEAEFDPDNDAALVIAGRGWHAGVIGIVAGRLAEQFHRPVVLISLDASGLRPAVGSARSIPGFDLHAALMGCKGRLLTCGGHKAAAGLSLNEDQLEAFRAEFCEHVAEHLTVQQREPVLYLDGEAPLSAFTWQVLQDFERLAPFGMGNARPVWCTSGVQLTEAPRKIGGGERHLSFKLAQHATRIRAVAFGAADRIGELEATDQLLDIAFKPVINTFRNQNKVELQLVDWRPTERQ